MAVAPSHIRIKRRREDDPLHALVLEERRLKIERQHVQYRLESGPDTKDTTTSSVASSLLTAPQPRRFELSVPSKKRNADDAGLMPTFVEKRWKGNAATDVADSGQHLRVLESNRATPLKRPGARTLRKDAPSAQATPTRGIPAPTDDVANALHKFAMEEAAQEEAEERANQQATVKPRVVIQPKRSVRRLRDRQPQNAHLNGLPTLKPMMDVHMEDEASDDDEYVYDVYVRDEAASKAISADLTDAASQSIGFLVITEEDEALWETYLEDEDGKFDTDDEDENAEDYYGADYPEDEVASDDEYDKGAYGYRHGGSDDEQWDSDTGAFSDEEDAMKNPWKKAPWLKSQKQAGEGDEEDDED